MLDTFHIDLLYHVSSFLPLKYVLKCRLLSKNMKKKIDQSSIWELECRQLFPDFKPDSDIAKNPEFWFQQFYYFQNHLNNGNTFRYHFPLAMVTLPFPQRISFHITTEFLWRKKAIFYFFRINNPENEIYLTVIDMNKLQLISDLTIQISPPENIYEIEPYKSAFVLCGSKFIRVYRIEETWKRVNCIIIRPIFENDTIWIKLSEKYLAIMKYIESDDSCHVMSEFWNLLDCKIVGLEKIYVNFDYYIFWMYKNKFFLFTENGEYNLYGYDLENLPGRVHLFHIDNTTGPSTTSFPPTLHHPYIIVATNISKNMLVFYNYKRWATQTNQPGIEFYQPVTSDWFISRFLNIGPTVISFIPSLSTLIQKPPIDEKKLHSFPLPELLSTNLIPEATCSDYPINWNICCDIRNEKPLWIPSSRHFQLIEVCRNKAIYQKDNLIMFMIPTLHYSCDIRDIEQMKKEILEDNPIIFYQLRQMYRSMPSEEFCRHFPETPSMTCLSLILSDGNNLISRYKPTLEIYSCEINYGRLCNRDFFTKFIRALEHFTCDKVQLMSIFSCLTIDIIDQFIEKAKSILLEYMDSFPQQFQLKIEKTHCIHGLNNGFQSFNKMMKEMRVIADVNIRDKLGLIGRKCIDVFKSVYLLFLERKVQIIFEKEKLSEISALEPKFERYIIRDKDLEIIYGHQFNSLCDFIKSAQITYIETVLATWSERMNSSQTEGELNLIHKDLNLCEKLLLRYPYISNLSFDNPSEKNTDRARKAINEKLNRMKNSIAEKLDDCKSRIEFIEATFSFDPAKSLIELKRIHEFMNEYSNRIEYEKYKSIIIAIEGLYDRINFILFHQYSDIKG